MKSLGKQLGYAEGESDLDRSLLAVAMAQSVAKIGTLP
jgi:hypothetical protein